MSLELSQKILEPWYPTRVYRSCYCEFKTFCETMLSSKHCLSRNTFSGAPFWTFLSTWTCSRMPPAEKGKNENTRDNYWMLNLAIGKASEMKNRDIREFAEKPSTTFLTRGIVPHCIPIARISGKLLPHEKITMRGTFVFHWESSWALFRCSSRTPDHSAHLLPIYCSSAPPPGACWF